ncbi:MAG: aldolase/citrate lyase family protein [Ottowia sp.]|uniref:HpcH/HpaI aldolase family protein n=1 Tax=Ottowia sp. TaxID=1898956 RepID=UPI003C7147B7
MRLRENRIWTAIREDRVALGVNVQTGSAEIVEMVGAQGYEWVLIDCEHGAFGLDGAVPLIRAAEAVGVSAIVRVPDCEPSFIMRVLDAGAMGVVIPKVETAEQARMAVSAARYAMDGNGGERGACPNTRATWHFPSNWEQFARWSNENVFVMVLVETQRGIDNIEEILDVQGINSLGSGSFDLAQARGFPGQPGHPEVEALVARLMASARRRGIQPTTTLFANEPAAARAEYEKLVAAGYRILSAGSDRRMMSLALRDKVRMARGPEISPSKEKE